MLKKCLISTAPVWGTSFFSERARVHSQRVVASWGCDRINQSLFARFGNEVLSGPFRGMVLSPATKAEQIGPFLLGVYESELHRAWDLVLSGNFNQIIDVGAKFGYYAIGIARRYPASRVLAFDTDRWARRAMAEMADDNQVSNVEVRGYCSPEWLAENLTEGSLILSDCEGFEGQLFCSVPIPNLASATLIIETHENAAQGVTARLRQQLERTHSVVEIVSDTSRRMAPVDLSFLNEREQWLAINEVRGRPQVWLVAMPKGWLNAAPNE
jgi:hypothetical protein